ncbi:NUDIX hydrolase [Thermodesulfobacteriota bacterium]
MPLKPWELISSNLNRSFRVFNLRTDRSVSPRTNKEHDFYIMESSDWVNIIPITPQNEVLLVRQFRHGIKEITLEIPGGIVEKGDVPIDTARKELSEETGYRAAKMMLLGAVHPNPAFLNNRCYTFLARDIYLEGEQKQDDKEDIEITLKSLDEIPRLIKDGQITHSLVLAAFYRYYFEYLPSIGK